MLRTEVTGNRVYIHCGNENNICIINDFNTSNLTIFFPSPLDVTTIKIIIDSVHYLQDKFPQGIPYIELDLMVKSLFIE